MKPSMTIKFLLALTALVALGACSNHDGNEWERLVCEVESVNAGTPLMSVYLSPGDDKEVGTADDEYPIDWVPVLFRARPYSSSMVMPEDGPQTTFTVTSYDLIWHPIGNAPAELTDYNVTRGLTAAIVPVFEDAACQVLIADRVMKEEPWYRALFNTPGSSFTANCELIFYGHESGSSREVAIPTGFMVTFYGVGIVE